MKNGFFSLGTYIKYDDLGFQPISFRTILRATDTILARFEMESTPDIVYVLLYLYLNVTFVSPLPHKLRKLSKCMVYMCIINTENV